MPLQQGTTLFEDIDNFVFLLFHEDRVYRQTITVKGEDAEGIIYTYLYEKVKRKVDELLPVINEYNPTVTEPIGMNKAGWLWSRERKIQGWADKFNT